MKKEMENEDFVDIEIMLKNVGDFGIYQVLLMILFCFINAFSAFHYFGQTFISVLPDHKCETEGIYEDRVIAGKCSIAIFGNATMHEVPCNDWVYNGTFGYIGIIEELDWVCTNDWKPAIGQSVFFIGSVVGTLIFGILADRIGRLHVLVSSNLLAFVGNVVTILSKDATVFAISRFIAGCATDTNFVMMYIIVMEYIRPKLRTMGLNLCIGIFYCLSCMAVPWVAIMLGNWRLFLIVVSVPHLIVLTFYFYVPESAQWLISKGRMEEAILCFRRIARINRRQVDERLVDGLRAYYNQRITPDAGHENIGGLLRTPKLRKKVMILTFKSMVMTLCYDAISRNVNGLQYSPFYVFSITSATIFPACLLILMVQDKIGRKALASSSLLLSGIFTIISGLLQATYVTDDPQVLISLAVISRLGINVAYNSGAQYAVELIPTVVRAQGVSAIHVAGYAASFFSPQIIYLGNMWKPSPDVILGVLLMFGAYACLFLPETLGKVLPVTIQEGEEFGEDEGIFEFHCCHAPTESMIGLSPKKITVSYS